MEVPPTSTPIRRVIGAPRRGPRAWPLPPLRRGRCPRFGWPPPSPPRLGPDGVVIGALVGPIRCTRPPGSEGKTPPRDPGRPLPPPPPALRRDGGRPGGRRS